MFLQVKTYRQQLTDQIFSLIDLIDVCDSYEDERKLLRIVKRLRYKHKHANQDVLIHFTEVTLPSQINHESRD